MQKFKIMLDIEEYLKAHNIFHVKDFDGENPRIIISYSRCYKCPDNTLEACIWFFKDFMEVRTYFDENASEWCRSSKHLLDVMRLFNFINDRVWLCTYDGAEGMLYSPTYLYTHRIYITEDENFDITLTTIIPYDFFELAPLETKDYITAHCTFLMNELSPAVFGVLLGELDYSSAIKYIKSTDLIR